MTTKYIKRNVNINIKTKTLDREGKKYNVNIRDKIVLKIITK